MLRLLRNDFLRAVPFAEKGHTFYGLEGQEVENMTALITIASIATVLAAGVGLMLLADRKEQKRMIENGGRRF